MLQKPKNIEGNKENKLMKYFIIALMSIFIFTATPMVKANNNVVKPIRELPSIQETSDKDMISYRRRPRPRIIIRRPRARIIIVPRRRHRQRPHYRRHRGCFIDTISELPTDSIWSKLLNK